jgi:hypothetical protein
VPGIDLHCSLHQRNKNGALGRRFHICCRSGWQDQSRCANAAVEASSFNSATVEQQETS